jgi:hypothetical protein
MTARVLIAVVLSLGAIAAAAEPPEFVLGDSRRSLIERAVALKSGELGGGVIAKLGPPSSIRELKGPEGSRGGRALRYNVVTWIKAMPNDDDQYVEVLLDKSDRVSTVYVRAALDGRK